MCVSCVWLPAAAQVGVPRTFHFHSLCPRRMPCAARKIECRSDRWHKAFDSASAACAPPCEGALLGCCLSVHIRCRREFLNRFDLWQARLAKSPRQGGASESPRVLRGALSSAFSGQEGALPGGIKVPNTVAQCIHNTNRCALSRTGLHL